MPVAVKLYAMVELSDSQYGPQHGNGVIPQPALPVPTRHPFKGYRVGIGYVAVLAFSHGCRQGLIVEQDVVLVVKLKASTVHVGGTDKRYVPVQGQRLSVQQSTLVFKYSDSGSEQITVIAPTCRTDDP